MSQSLRSFYIYTIGVISFFLFCCQSAPKDEIEVSLSIPFVESPPIIDGDLSEWKDNAFSDGHWNLERVKQTSWYDPKRNRLNVHAGEDESRTDLDAVYYIAWDNQYLYLGAEVKDNEHDVSESKHEPKRWYYKDAIAWFIEAPKDTIGEKFGSGDHGFGFVIDTTMPDYGAWWRHGNEKQSYIEEALSNEACNYSITMDPWGRNKADYILEARINMQATFGAGDKKWKAPQDGDRYSMMIVHCDPDGGEYGGHLLIYGKGDDDSTWREIELSK